MPIWEKIGNTFHFVNVNATTELVTSVNTISSKDLKVELFPTVSTSQSVLNLESAQYESEVNIQLFNAQGQSVQSIFSGDLIQGIQSFDIPTYSLKTGLYFLNIRTSDGAVLTKRLIVQ